eukprot:5358338-Pleurochrysis_carterae.AAC.1
MMTKTTESSRPLKDQSETRTPRCGPRRGDQTGVTTEPKPEATQTSRQDNHAEMRTNGERRQRRK